jgi:hypothetical protein
MFDIDHEATFTVPVTVLVPIDGGHREETFDATYRVMPTSEAQDMNLRDGTTQREFLRKVVVSLNGIVDRNKNPIPFSAELLERVLDKPYASFALADAYGRAISKVKTGN